MKKTILVVSFLLLLPAAASAFSLKNGDSVYVPKNETIEGNLYAAGGSLNIEGKVTGDLICVGQTINVSGQIDGDIICAGQTINVSGQVGGSLRAAGNSVNLSGKVARNAMVFGATVLASSDSVVGWDMLVGGAFINVAGQIGRDLYGGGGQATIAGQVGKNVKLNLSGQNKKTTNPLVITSTAKIGGDVSYTALQDAIVEGGASIKGKIARTQPSAMAQKGYRPAQGHWFGKLIFLFAALVIGLVLISFWKPQILKITDLMLSKAGPALGWGVLALLLTPIIVIILMFTVIGLPLAFILLALWLVALYLSKILVGILIGRSLLTNFWAKKKDSLILAMIIGIVAAYLIFAIPFLGGLAAFLAVLWGLGGILLALKKS